MPEQSKKRTQKKYFDPISMAARTHQVVHRVEEHDKMAMLEYVIKNSQMKRTAIVCKSKKKADELGTYLNKDSVKVKVIHGNHRKSDQETVAQAFISGEINQLITTDKVLQQLELTNIERIIYLDTPIEADNYFKSLAFVDEKGELISLLSSQEEGLFSVIEILLKIEIPDVEVEGFVFSEPVVEEKVDKDKKKKVRHRLQKGDKIKSKAKP